MSDDSTPATTPEPAATPELDSPPDWEAQLEAAGQEAPGRRDGFDLARKKTFLKALAKGATLADAARAARVSPRTVYNHQDRDPNFAAACRAAVEVSAPKIELAAYERGVIGVEEDVISYGKHVGTRTKRSDALLQTLLKGSNPDKYGPQAGFKRGKIGKKNWREQERVKIRAEIEAEQEVSEEEADEIRARIMRRIDRLRDQYIEKGWYRHEAADQLIEPGWTMIRTTSLCVSCASREVRELAGPGAAG
jgi:hypothetical protein